MTTWMHRISQRNPCKDDFLRNRSTCDCECDKMWEMFECLDIKYGSCKNSLFAELVFACENYI